MPVQVELSHIIISEICSQQVILLREVNGAREFPIVIGIVEASAIDRYVRHEASPRPMTHDLLANAIESLGGRIHSVYIHRVEDQTFYACLRLEHGAELIELDSRPSDAIAMALSLTPPVPIFVDEQLLQQLSEESPEDKTQPDE